jgi:SWI/SNF-related matrix-associated actin-dependent regulator 1 of chromatin subfamily A
MKLTHDGKKFIFICAYPERRVPDNAKFIWDGVEREWYTHSLKAAARLRSFADRLAERKLNRALITIEPWAGRLVYPKEFSLLPFQDPSIRYALARNRSYLALDPGLGKGVITAVIIRTLGKRAVVICPPALALNVQAELQKWTGQWVLILESGRDLELCATSNILVVPDSIIHRLEVCEELEMAGLEDSVLIVDEAHRYSNSNAKRTEALLGKADDTNDRGITEYFEKIVLLSGTPLRSRSMELYSVLSKLAPETIDFKNRFQYGLRYCNAYQNGFGWDFSGDSNTEELFENVKRVFMHRVRKADVLPDLPPKTEEMVLLGEDLPAVVSKLDRGMLKRFSPEDLMGHLAPNEQISTYRKELGKAKVKPALAYLRELLDGSDEKILVFAVHKEVVAELAKGLATHHPFVVTGDTGKKTRQEYVEEFQRNPTRRVFVGNIEAAGVGFTLTAATRVVIVEPTWVPAENEQAADPAHRIGQTEPVFVQYLVFKNSIDRAVIETNLRKRTITHTL